MNIQTQNRSNVNLDVVSLTHTAKGLSQKKDFRGKTTKLLENLGRSGCRSESSSNPQRDTLWTVLFWYVEVGILEVYQGDPLPLLEGGPDGFQCLHFEFLHLEELVQFGSEIGSWVWEPKVAG